MNKYKRPIFNESNIGENPFLEKFTIPVSSLEFRGQFKKDKDNVWVPVVGEVENDTSTKVYNSSERRLKMCKLSSSAKALLLWIIYEAESGKDYLWINRVRYQEENKIRSVNTYRSALAELKDLHFVWRTKIGGVYWINPSLFFSGNRVTKFPTKVTERK